MSASSAKRLTTDIWRSLGGDAGALQRLSFVGSGDLPSYYAVTDLAAAAIGAAALSVADLIGLASSSIPTVTIDRRLASFWFGWSIRPHGWEMPGPWDPIAGDYAASDGWIKLHTNAPHHRAAAERVLGQHDDKASMANAVRPWTIRELEAAIVAEGGCAAEMRPVAAWTEHPQGIAVAREPLIHFFTGDAARTTAWRPSSDRPLAGLRVLDLTRVIAGPVATRFLAGYGADVLRIDPPDWGEPAVVPEVTLGKRCARLDLKTENGKSQFENLLAQTDILVHGYRKGALERLGYDSAARRALSPGLIDVSLNAYGWSGPWANRRGFESLVQMSAGIAEAGMRWKQSHFPAPLPVQALDHATGYLIAAAVLKGLRRRLLEGTGTGARLSLARTAKFLVDAGATDAAPSALSPETAADLAPAIEHTDWGEAHRLKPPAAIDGAPMRWDRPARALGAAEPRWDAA